MASLISPPCWLPSTREEEICSPLNQPSPFLSVIFPSNKSRFDLLSLQLKPKICSNLVVAAARRNHSHGVDPVGKQDGRACLVAVAGHNIGPARGLDPVLNPAGQAWISSPEEDACACHGSEHAAVPILSAATAVYLHGLDRYLPGEEVDLVLQDVESLDGIRAFVVCTGGGLLDGNIGDDSFAAHHRIGVVLCWDLEHYQGVVKVVSCKCFCCIMDARQDEDHSEGDDSPPFGLILRRQLRASTSMIPRYNGRDDFKLGSVKLQIYSSTTINLKCRSPLHCWESRRLFGWQARSRSLKIAAVVVRQFSQLTCHQAPAVIFLIIRISLVFPVFYLCNVAPLVPAFFPSRRSLVSKSANVCLHIFIILLCAIHNAKCHFQLVGCSCLSGCEIRRDYPLSLSI